MADTLTLQILPETTERLKQLAADRGESVEDLASRVLTHLADLSGPYPDLLDEDLKDLNERLKNPGPYATPEEAEAILSRFRRKD